MLDLYDYPVMVTDGEIAEYLDVQLAGNREICYDAHRIVYDFLIYPTFNADIKNRIIVQYKAELEKPLKRAILAQLKYLYANGGNIAEWNGILGGAQAVDNKEQQEILTKIVSPQVVNILKGAAVDILYAGG